MSDLKALLDELDALHQKAVETPGFFEHASVEEKFVYLLRTRWPQVREAVAQLLTDKERLAALAEAAVDYIDVNVCDSDTTAKMRVAWERLKPLLDQYRSSGESPR
jgi:hypothetical protein